VQDLRFAVKRLKNTLLGRAVALKKISVKIKKLNEMAVFPSYMTSGAAGMDLSACLSEPLIIESGERALVPTGLAFELPCGTEAQIRPRSSLALKNGITVLNSPGTIDSDYRGELSVILINLSKTSVVINSGERIAQIVFAVVSKAVLCEVDFLTDSKRGKGGFGSTGK
jgi:dUTP pyrophosphatase